MATGSPESFMETIRRDEWENEWKRKQDRANDPKAIAHDRRVDLTIDALSFAVMIASGYWLARKLLLR